MSRVPIATLVVLVAVFGQYASAQLQLCDPKLKVIGIKEIKMKETKQTGSTSEITIAFKRPMDGPAGGMYSCVSECSVDAYEAGSKTVLPAPSSSKVNVSPAATDLTFTSKNLKPGSKYEFYVSCRNPTLGASGNGAGLRSQPMTAAGSACKQPGPVFNIRKTSATNQGSKSTMTVEWNPPQTTDAACVKEYVVDVYPAGKKTISERISTNTVTTPKFTSSNYNAGSQYEFFIYARNPALGASGNGQGTRSAALMAPVGIATAGRRLQL